MAIVDKIKVGTVTYDIGVDAANVSGSLNASAIPNLDASKITSGTLPITRGGTNATTAAGALTSLGAAAASHNHAAGDITSGTLALERGGTGITVNPSMLTNLGTTSAASVFASSPRPGVTGTLPIANGGTNATTAADARTQLGAAASSHNHAAGDINSGTIATARLPVSTTQSNSNATVPTSALVYSMNQTLTSLNAAISGITTSGNATITLLAEWAGAWFTTTNAINLGKITDLKNTYKFLINIWGSSSNAGSSLSCVSDSFILDLTGSGASYFLPNSTSGYTVHTFTGSGTDGSIYLKSYGTSTNQSLRWEGIAGATSGVLKVYGVKI